MRTITKFEWTSVAKSGKETPIVYYLRGPLNIREDLEDSEIASIVIPLSYKAMHRDVAE